MEISITTLSIIAVMVAIGLLVLAAIDIVLSLHEVEARGCTNGIAVNASQGRCIH